MSRKYTNLLKQEEKMKNNENDFGFFKADEVITWEEPRFDQKMPGKGEKTAKVDCLSGLPNEVLLP
jgi:hypothetical protein